MTDYADLIARLEAAPGPDREIDLHIARWRGVTVVRRRDDDAGNEEFTYWHYTESIDAAASLIPLGHDWSLCTVNGKPVAACVPMSEDGCSFSDCCGATPALALCIAALHARAVLSSAESTAP